MLALMLTRISYYYEIGRKWRREYQLFEYKAEKPRLGIQEKLWKVVGGRRAGVFASQWAEEHGGHRSSKSTLLGKAGTLQEQPPTVLLSELWNLPSHIPHSTRGPLHFSLLKLKMHTKALKSGLKHWAFVVFKNQRSTTWEREMHKLFALPIELLENNIAKSPGSWESHTKQPVCFFLSR